MLRLLCLAACILFVLAGVAHAAAPVTVSLTLGPPGATIPPDFLGLSFEASRVLASSGAEPVPRLFSADDKPLLNMFHTLGIHSLRIGGNTADRATVPIPAQDDIDALFAFAKAADVKVIYTLRLRDTAPEQVTTAAKYVWDHYAPQLCCFEIGNEPDLYFRSYSDYRSHFELFLRAVSAVAPKAPFCGPSATGRHPSWAAHLADDFPDGRGGLKLITQHSYPCGRGKFVTDPQLAIDSLLSPDRLADYQKLYDDCLPAARDHHLDFRLEETNSFSQGGAADASNSFADALWALDYINWWAAHGIAGVNFHTSDLFPSASNHVGSWYAAFSATTHRDGYIARPLAYALAAFSLTAESRSVPVLLDNPSNLNFTAYAGQTVDGRLYLTLINKSHGASGQSAGITLPPGYVPTHRLILAAASVTSTRGVTLGSMQISESGVWPGHFEPLPHDSALTLAPSSAMIVQLDHR